MRRTHNVNKKQNLSRAAYLKFTVYQYTLVLELMFIVKITYYIPVYSSLYIHNFTWTLKIGYTNVPSYVFIYRKRWPYNRKGNSINGQTVTMETESKWTRPVLYGIFGLAGLLFFITLVYIFTHQQTQRLTVVGVP